MVGRLVLVDMTGSENIKQAGQTSLENVGKKKSFCLLFQLKY